MDLTIKHFFPYAMALGVGWLRWESKGIGRNTKEGERKKEKTWYNALKRIFLGYNSVNIYNIHTPDPGCTS